MTLSEIGGRIKRAKAKNFSNGCPGFSGCCPAHEDKDPSFAVWETPDHWLHFKCQKGCQEPEILASLGMTLDDRRTTEYDQGMPPKPPETSYVYEDAQGQALFKKVRFYMKDPKHPDVWTKGFKQCGMNGESNLNHLNGKSKVLYNWPDVINAVRDGSTVYVNEGEKACELMEIAGLCATCQPGGAGKDRPETKWLPEHTEALRGAKKVVVVADRDDVGEVYATYVASAIRGVVGSVTIVQSAVDKPKADAFDHFEKGFSVDQFVVRRDLMPRRGLVLESIDDFEDSEPEFLFGRHIRAAQCNLLDADGGVGKTTLALAFAAAGSNGFDPLSGRRFEPFKTLYFGDEDEGGELKKTYYDVGGKRGFLDVYQSPFKLDAEGLRQLKETIIDGAYRQVIFDVFFYFLQGVIKDSNDMMGAAKVCGELRKVAMATRAGFIDLRHTGKSTMGKSASDLGLGSVQFRNSHRSQLVIRWHPDTTFNKGVRIVTHEKASIRSERGEPFSFSQKNGIFSIESNVANPFDDQGEPLKKPQPRQDAKEFLTSLFDECRVWVQDEVVRRGAEYGLSLTTLNRARAELGITSGKAGYNDGRYRWTSPDPEADALFNE